MRKLATAVVLLFCVFCVTAPVIHADTADDLRAKIEERNKVIAELDAEIAQYQSQIGETSKKATSLQNTLNTLNQTIKKLSAEVSKTNTSIAKTNDTIELLNSEVADEETKIAGHLETLITLIKERADLENRSLIESLLEHDRLSDAWNYLAESWQVADTMNQDLAKLKASKIELEKKISSRESEKKNLETYKSTLSDQQKLVQINQKDKSDLLKQTKNTQSAYQKQLADRLAKKTAFEKELLDFESQLNLVINPNTIPGPKEGVLAWPVDPPRVITQEFGDTDFARAHVQAYNGKGHNGIDFGASVGTPIKSAGDGIVVGTGNTDSACPGASYGKWVLIKHNNGLSSLYAHLSLIKVAQGEQVSRSQVIGYSGNTGYTTGPHLHFTVYASQGVEVLSKKSLVCGTTYTMPIADLKAYLNPLLFL